MRRGIATATAAMALLLLAHLARGQTSRERAYVDAVLEGLVKAGVVTREQAQEIKDDAAEAAGIVEMAMPPKPKWTDTIKLSGYTQARFLYYPDAAADTPNNEFMVRRARIKLGANPTPRSEVELQLDMGEGDVTVKDAWVQYDLTEAADWRIRVGQQKVPFGFETVQSSGSRVPLERNWLSRRFVDGERDRGAVLYWTDPADAPLFDEIKRNAFGEGSGYGTVAIGVFNGQGLNAEANDAKHVALRYAKPWKIGHRPVEAGASYYGGRYFSSGANQNFAEHLVGVHAYLPPQPLGLQAEWFTGETEGDNLNGFYAMGLWRPCPEGVAFARYNEYNGPRKGKGVGNVYDRNRWSLGYAHQLDSRTEVTVEYDFEDTPTGRNDLLGTQLQISY